MTEDLKAIHAPMEIKNPSLREPTNILPPERIAEIERLVYGGYVLDRDNAKALLASHAALLAELDAKSTTCPECNGAGKCRLVLLHAKPVDGAPPMTAEQAKELTEALSVCQVCDGTGKAPPERLAWRQMGEEWRTARLALMVGMREWAERVGVLPSEYLAMEAGRRRPDPKCSPVAALKAEVEALKARILDDNKAYGCELRDPNGTIWEHAKNLQAEVERLSVHCSVVVEQRDAARQEVERLRGERGRERIEMLNQAAERQRQLDELKGNVHELRTAIELLVATTNRRG